MTDCCPTCHRPFADKPKPRRICHVCKQPMANDHKWHLVEVDGYVVQQHRHCDNPTSYLPKKHD